MRHAQILGARDPLMWRLVPALTREMGQAYPELLRAEALITETLKLEETRFRTTLARGLAILEDETRPLAEGGVLSGETAFKLYDTFGFPLDLTQDALRARGLSVDLDGFNAAMARQRAEARRAWAGSGESATETVWYGLRERVGATEFLGYETETAEGVIGAIVRDGVEVDRLEAGETGSLILNQTPFYGELGGQVGDVGEIIGPGFRAVVSDTRKKLGDLVVHDVAVVDGAARVGMAVELAVDHAARTATRANHSATHILHEALRLVLGDHVAQKGSLVSPERLRFDFAHPKAITPDELTAVEDIANRVVLGERRGDDAADEPRRRARIRSARPLRREIRRRGAGRQHGADRGRRGARARLFGRALRRHACASHRRHRPHNDRRRKRGRGRRAPPRGQDARRGAQEADRRIARAGRTRRASARAGRRGAEAARKPDRRQAQARARTRRRQAQARDGRRRRRPGNSVREIAGVKFYARAVTGIDMKDLKSLADEAKQSVGSGVVAIAATAEDGKASLVVAVTPDQTGRFNAVDLVRLGSAALGGKGGGGRPDMAQAGGPDGANAGKALEAVEEAIRARA